MTLRFEGWGTRVRHGFENALDRLREISSTVFEPSRMVPVMVAREPRRPGVSRKAADDEV